MGGPVIRAHADGTAVDVEGLRSDDQAALADVKWKPEEWASLFALHVEPAGGGDLAGRPAVLGSYAVEGEALRFTPRFPLKPGVHYRAVFHPERLPKHPVKGKDVEEAVLLPKPPRPAAEVEHVYPSADTLPENQLKFYLCFTAPMSRGEAYDHVHLLDADGKPVVRPFLELGEELWDPEGKRLTLFIDPGRIKRGLKPREDLGPVLEKGKRYTLVLDADWPDAEGDPLKAAYRKTFTAGPMLETQPDPKAWRVEAPPAGGREPLAVTFPGPLDHALLQWMLTVEDADGRAVPGEVEVTDDETRWRFTPKESWAAGEYRLVADTRLEDLAGNSIARPFEVDLLRPVEAPKAAEAVRLPFAVRPAKGTR
jgi:hypothetical protein